MRAKDVRDSMKYSIAVAFAAGLLGCSYLAPAHGRSDVSSADVPTFQLRARIATLGGRPPSGKTFTYRFAVPSGTVTSTDSGWSDWPPFGGKAVKATLASYPYTIM